MNARRLILATLAALCASAAGLSLSAQAVLAFPPYLSQIAGTPSGSFSGACGVAADPANQDVYVADLANDAIDVFNYAGAYQSQISGMSIPSGPFTGSGCSIAVSGKTGDVYVEDSSANVVYVFDALGSWIATMSGSDTPTGSFGALDGIGVAVDQTSGEVDVADPGNSVIDRFNSANEYQSQFQPPPTESGWTAIAADPSGDVYLGEVEGGIYKFDPTGSEINFAYAVGRVSALTTDSGGNLYVGDTNRTQVDEFDPSGSLVDGIFEPDLSPASVAVNGIGDVYVLRGHFGIPSNSIEIFGAADGLPEVETGGVSDVTGASATIAGTVNPDEAATTYQFEYGLTAALGSVSPASPGSVGSDSSVHALSTELAGLTPGTTYYYRIAATNATGTTYGRKAIFETPLVPAATTGAVSNLAETSATIAGTVNPEGKATTYQFEYGASAAYGSVSPASPGSVGEDSAVHAESAELAGLTPGTRYHYRITATNPEGTSHGLDSTFRTDGPPGVDGESVSNLTKTSAVIEAEVNPDGFDTHVYFEYGAGESYGSSSAPVDIGSGNSDQQVSVPLSGLQSGVSYHFRVVASNSEGSPAHGADLKFTAVPPASIDGESFSDVGSASAAVGARVNDLGVASSYHYEYGTTESYGSMTPAADLGTVNGDVGAPAKLSGLQPDTVYHFRVVVTNEFGTVEGADVVFRTLVVSIQGLPDGRVYEMVTPRENHDANIDVPQGQGTVDFPGVDGNPSQLPFQAAAGGDAVTYVGNPTLGGNGNEGTGGGNQYLATRSPQGGWTQVNIQPGLYRTPLYQAFSSDLSVGVMESFDAELPPLAPGAPREGYRVLYTRSGDGGYHALLTATPPNRTPSEFGTSGRTTEKQLVYAGASSDFGHILFEANDALTADAEAKPPAENENDLYDSVGGQLHLVNVLPNGAVATDAAFGAPQLFNSEGGYVLGHVISGDGSRVFWTDLSTGDLYVRKNDSQSQSPLNGSGECTVPTDACTVQVDASKGPGAGGGGLFWTASSVGSKVFFTDASLLTNDSTATAGQPDLYEFDVESGMLTDLSSDANAGEHANVLGVIGAGEDGEYVYFVATGRLAVGASAGEPNLYVTHHGVVTFITALSYGDFGSGGFGTPAVGMWQQSFANRTAEVTPDGRSLVFYSPVRGEVYHYEVEGGRLVCVSCSPSVEVSGVSAPLVAGASGGYLTVANDFNYTYQARVISGDGSRVFFDSAAPLVARDVNGVQDVYEWERDGAGSCRESPGCIYLLSGGTSSSWSSLLDASASGDDVFVITRARLVTEDDNGNFNVFDARIGGLQPLAPPACSGTGCQGVPLAPPVFATPSSETFNGVGNFPASTGPAAKTKPKGKVKTRPKAKAKRKRRAGKKTGRRRSAKARGRKAGRAAHRARVGDTGRSGR